MHVWNSEYNSHGDEARAFGSAWAAVKKGLDVTKSLAFNVDGDRFGFYLPIAKAEKQKDGSVIVSGYASTPDLDLDGEIVSLDAVKKALPGYWEWRNIREMHQPSAVGVAQEANIDDRGLFLTSKITDKEAAQKVLDEVYKGYSIGGRKLSKTGNVVTEIELIEVSLVDRPANPECRIELAKSAKKADAQPGYLVKAAKSDKSSRELAKALASIAKVSEFLAKEAPLPLPVKCAAHDKLDCAECAKLDKGGDEPGDGKKPYGDVTYADPGHQADGKKRYPIDTEEHVRAALGYIGKPKNAGKYSPENLASIKAKIYEAAKKFGIEVSDKKPKSKAKKAARISKAIQILASADRPASLASEGRPSFLNLVPSSDGLGSSHREATGLSKVGGEPRKDGPSFLSLRKGMGTVGSLSYCFDSVRGAQRSLMMEGKREGKDSTDFGLAKDLGDIAERLATVIGQKAAHEGKEARDLSDADDMWLTETLGEDFLAMSKNVDISQLDGDPMTKALLSTILKAAKPTAQMRMRMARGEMKKAKAVRKEAQDMVKSAHGLLKTIYMAKEAALELLAKAGKKPSDDDMDDMDKIGKALTHMQKAYGDLDTLKTFMKAADGQMKEAGRVSQGGGEVTDGEGGAYEVPAGVRGLSPSDLAGAGPGYGQRGSAPVMMPVDHPYPGPNTGKGLGLRPGTKISAEHAEALIRAASAEARADALEHMPQPGRTTPVGFDATKFVSTAATDAGMDVGALTKGIDTRALNLDCDDPRHKKAAALITGRMLTSGNFGKSIWDPEFRGMAGTAADA